MNEVIVSAIAVAIIATVGKSFDAWLAIWMSHRRQAPALNAASESQNPGSSKNDSRSRLAFVHFFSDIIIPFSLVFGTGFYSYRWLATKNLSAPMRGDDVFITAIYAASLVYFFNEALNSLSFWIRQKKNNRSI